MTTKQRIALGEAQQLKLSRPIGQLMYLQEKDILADENTEQSATTVIEGKKGCECQHLLRSFQFIILDIIQDQKGGYETAVLYIPDFPVRKER